MLYGSWLLASIIDNENGAREFIKIDPAPELFRGPEVELYDFVRAHIQKHGKPPARVTVQKHMPEASLPSDIPEPATYYYERMQKRHQHLELKQVVQKAAELLNDDNGDAAEDAVFETLVDLRRVEHRRQVFDYAQQGAGLIKEHIVNVKKGLDVGIPFGWPTVDKDSLGMQAGDLISFIGRPGKGKTWMMLYLMMHAWRNGFSPMFISMEMAPKLIIQRLAALDTHTSATQIKMATVSHAKSKEMFAQLLENKNRPPCWVIDGGLSATPDDILLHALEKKPDVIYIDGAYLLRSSNRNAKQWERIAENTEVMKRDICEIAPTVASWQFNRDSTKKKQGQIGVEGIAGADQIGQLSSLVFGMFDEDNIENMYKRRIEILKGRHGEFGEFHTNWIFDQWPFMDFSEIVEQTLADLSSL